MRRRLDFSVFGSAVDHLDGAETLIGHTTGTSIPVGGLAFAHYLVTATDCHGNRSDAAVLDALSGTAEPLPTVARLQCGDVVRTLRMGLVR
jgi:hypothetical protein